VPSFSQPQRGPPYAADTEVDLAEMFIALGDEGLLAAYERHGRCYETGSPSGIRDLERLLATHDMSTGSGAHRP
jgi:hypothetical protein